MHSRVDDTKRVRAQDRIGRVLNAVFREWVFQTALTCAVFVAIADGFASLNQGTFV